MIVDRLEYSQVPQYLAEVVTGSSVPVSGAHPVVSKFEVIIILFICILLFLFSPPFPVFRLLSAVSVRRLVCFFAFCSTLLLCFCSPLFHPTFVPYLASLHPLSSSGFPFPLSSRLAPPVSIVSSSPAPLSLVPSLSLFSSLSHPHLASSSLQYRFKSLRDEAPRDGSLPFVQREL